MNIYVLARKKLKPLPLITDQTLNHGKLRRCPRCQPHGKPYQIKGRWYIQPAVICEVCSGRRPPKYWFTVFSQTSRIVCLADQDKD